MDWKSREITHHYNLRSLRGPRLRSRTRDQRNHNDASRSNSHLESSYHNSRNSRTQQQHRRDNSQRERRRNRSQGDRVRDRSQQSRRMNSTRRAHKALSGISDPPSDNKPNEDESDDIKCIICIDTVDDSDMKYVRCGHSFHRKCCNNWLKVNNACPICRTVVAPRRICVDNFNRERVIDRVIDDTPINDIIYFFTLSVMGDLDV